MNQDFYSALMLALQELITTNLPEIQFIDQDLDQDSNGNLTLPMAYPAILIDFTATDFSQESGMGLFASTKITMRLIANPISQSYADAPLAVRQDALGFYDLEHRLISILHGWTPSLEWVQPLSIMSARTIKSDPALRSRELIFSTAFELEAF